MVLVQLKQKDMKALKEKWYKEQDGYCPLFNKQYPIEKFSLDHRHKLKHELPDESGKGCCRGLINFQANSIEGKITNAFRRYGGDKEIDLILFLRNLADYLEHNKIHSDPSGIKYIHPTEEPKALKLMKSSYKRLVKVIAGKQKVPEYNGKLTKKLEELYKKYMVVPEFHGQS